MVDDLFSLKGKNAVVVGGAGGIGHGLAQGLARYGARVTLADINLAALQKAADDIQAATGQAPAIKVVDCSQESSVQQLVADAVATTGRVHILVNAQGYNAKAAATEFPMEEWDKLFSVNIRGRHDVLQTLRSAHGRARRRQDHQSVFDQGRSRRDRR